MAGDKNHPLTRYRNKHSLTLAAFAAVVPTTKSTISRIESGYRQPGFALLRAIVAATRGELTADDIINFEPPHKAMTGVPCAVAGDT
jgi:transcriptional regulator with XRE-family HTH domain